MSLVLIKIVEVQAVPQRTKNKQSSRRTKRHSKDTREAPVAAIKAGGAVEAAVETESAAAATVAQTRDRIYATAATTNERNG